MTGGGGILITRHDEKRKLQSVYMYSIFNIILYTAILYYVEPIVKFQKVHSEGWCVNDNAENAEFNRL